MLRLPACVKPRHAPVAFRRRPGAASSHRSMTCLPDAPSTWTAMMDCSLPDKARACIFCGLGAGFSRRCVFLDDVRAILAAQRDEGVDEPVNRWMQNILDAAQVRFALVGNAGTEATLVSCMCCYHWIARRQERTVVRFPLQNLYWYTKSMDLHNRRNYDARVMHRMAGTLTLSTTNYYRALYSPEELEFLRAAAAAPIAEFHAVAARHYMAHNAEPLFLPDELVTEAYV